MAEQAPERLVDHVSSSSHQTVRFESLKLAQAPERLMDHVSSSDQLMPDQLMPTKSIRFNHVSRPDQSRFVAHDG